MPPPMAPFLDRRPRDKADWSVKRAAVLGTSARMTELSSYRHTERS
jgi:hypothetical protein